MLQLKRPSVELVPSYLAFMNAMAANGDKVWEANLPSPGESNEDLVARFLRAEHTPPQPGFVRELLFWACEGNELRGRISVRLELTPSLREFGGHIGYDVHPAHRRKGVATWMLREVLKVPQVREIGRLLLTCDPKNMGSVRTIEGGGGILEKTVWIERVQRNTCHYWITLN